MYCSKCGKEIMDEAVICPECGCAVNQNMPTYTQEGSKAGTMAIVWGIIGIVFAWLFALVGHMASIIGIIVGIKEYTSTKRMTGLALSIIGEACAIFSSIIGAVTVSSMF